jgi:uncharacterized protein
MFSFTSVGLLVTCGFLLLGCTTVAQPPVQIQVPPPISASPITTETMPSSLASPQDLPITAQLLVGDRKISLEVAKTQQEQTIGLMSRTSLSNDRGMLFPFNPPSPTQFWMKNTLIPLDMLFIRDGKIQNIQANVPPCKADPCPSYGPPNSVLIDNVLELNGGQAKILGLKVGDRIDIRSIATP